MVRCCIPNCPSTTEKGSKFYQLPRGAENIERRNIWIKNIKRFRKILPANVYVCEVHFGNDQFEEKSLDGNRFLKQSAVPDLFDIANLTERNDSPLPEKCNENDIEDINTSLKTLRRSKRKRTAVKFDKYDTEEKSEEEEADKDKNVDNVEKPKSTQTELVKCRTCLRITPKNMSYVMKQSLCGKTIKHIISGCLPELSSILLDTEYVCATCYRFLHKLIIFTNNCLEIEEQLRAGIISLEVKHENTLETSSKGNAYSRIRILRKPRKKASENPVNGKIPVEILSDLKNIKDDTSHEIVEDGTINDVTSNQPEEDIAQLLECPVCHIAYRSLRGIKSHLISVHEIDQSPQFECNVCGMKLIRYKDMVKHVNFHGHWCENCSKFFDSETELTAHKEKHPEKYVCLRCGAKLKTQELLEKHSLLHRILTQINDVIPLVKDKQYCEHCDFTSKRIDTLQKHLDTVHNKVECEVCNASTDPSNSSKIFCEFDPDNPDLPYKCLDCGSQFRGRTRWKRQKSQPNISEHVENSFQNSDIRKTYGKCVNVAEKMYKCVFCEYQTHSKNTLVNHFVVHIADRNRFKCDFCGLMLSSEQSKLEHEITHKSRANKFACSVCCKHFENEEDLIIHQTDHEEAATSLVCCICDAAFHSLAQLKAHVLDAHTERLEIQLELTDDSTIEIDLSNENERHVNEDSLEIDNNKLEEPLKNSEIVVSSENVSSTSSDVITEEPDRCENEISPTKNQEQIDNDCSICLRQSKNQKNLEVLECVHVLVFACAICNTVFQKRAELETHFRNEHTGHRISNSEDMVEIDLTDADEGHTVKVKSLGSSNKYSSTKVTAGSGKTAAEIKHDQINHGKIMKVAKKTGYPKLRIIKMLKPDEKREKSTLVKTFSDNRPQKIIKLSGSNSCSTSQKDDDDDIVIISLD